LSKGAGDLTDVMLPLATFYKDEGLASGTDLSSVNYDPTKNADVSTFQQLAQKLGPSLGLSSLNPRYSNGQLLFDVGLTDSAQTKQNVATPSLGNALQGLGFENVSPTGSASASVSGTYTLNLTFGIDLASGLTPIQRAFVTTG